MLLQEEWWKWFANKIGEHPQIAEAAEAETSLKDEKDPAVCSAKYYEVLCTAARIEVHQFIMDNCLCMEESELPTPDD